MKTRSEHHCWLLVYYTNNMNVKNVLRIAANSGRKETWFACKEGVNLLILQYGLIIRPRIDSLHWHKRLGRYHRRPLK